MEKLLIPTEQNTVSNRLLIGITTHTGIVGDKDDLFILESKIGQELTSKQATEVLYQMSKLQGKIYGSWQPVEVDLNFNGSGKIMIFHKHFGQFPNQGEVIHCLPDEKLIEHVKNRCK